MTLTERHALVEQYGCLVGMTRRRLFGSQFSPDVVEELEAEGRLALAQAAQTFEPTGGKAFRSWAITWVRNAMLNYSNRWQNGLRTRTRSGAPLPILVSLFDLDHARTKPAALVEPDFAPPLIERLLAQERFQALPPPVQAVVSLTLAGYSVTEIAAALPVSERDVEQALGRASGRCVSVAKAAANRRRSYRNQCGYRGVIRSPAYQGQRFQALIRLWGRTVYLSTWPTPEEAALVVDAAVLHYLGGEGHLNLLPEEVRDADPGRR
jgi:RNA polymerase sigma factor (sigma-70 family)